MKCSVFIPLTTIFFILGLNLPTQAQIQAPMLVCIDNDTLVWETPINNCGPFLGYIIFGSQNQGGPYAPIDTIRNQSQTAFFHQDAGGSVWYYYLESDFDCPGLNRVTSDTLDNRIPEIGKLQTVSVVGSQVVLNWAPSPSPETAGYIIARNTSAGTTIIDTVYDQTTYTDSEAVPHLQVETYFVTAIDRCGNTSLVDNPHSTILLKIGEMSECNQSISFSWTPYKGWDNGPEKYEIWVSANSEPSVLDGNVSGNTTSYILENVDDTVEYCFFIRAVEAGSGNTASSNIICQIANIVQPIRELFIENVSFNENDDVTINWRWNTNAQLTEATLSRSVNNGPFVVIHNISLSSPLMNNNTFTDPSVAEGQICYRIETTDQCGDQADSNLGCTINLSAVSDGQGSNQVTWTPFDFDQPSSLSYELFRVVGGAAQSVGILNGMETSFRDQIDLNSKDSGTICYYVIANAAVSLPLGGISQITTRSNLACTEQSSAIYIPNAFAPAGVNTEFRAYLQFGDPAEFLLEVYDRWGNQVFQTKSIDQGWDGAKNGQDLPAGVYIYRLLLTQNNGTIIERAGSVALIR